jgi:hypothetical protein
LLLEPHEVDPVVEQLVDWEPPLPLTEIGAPAAFPLRVLPSWARGWVEAISVEKNASPDIAANLLIAVGGGAIARSVIVSPWPGFYEPTNVYVIAALAPGQKKSPIFKESLRPVRSMERERLAAWKETQKRAVLTRDIAEKRRKALMAEAAGADGEINVEDLVERIEREIAGFGVTEAPPLPRLTTEDVTPEKLAGLLGELGRIIAASDEGSAFFENLAGKYSRSTSWDVFNKAHSGGDLIVDRKGSDTVITHDPALTLAIATQPRMLRDLWERPGAEGRGVLARPLYSLPSPVYSAERTPPASQHVRDEYDRRIRRLYENTPELAYDEGGHPRPITLRFDREGETLFERWGIEISDECRERALHDDNDSAYVGWHSKLAGQTARLAGILHVTTNWTSGAGATATIITGDTVADAITLARHYRSHALAAFGLMGELPHQRLAARILNWIQQIDKNRFTTREAHRPINSRSRTVAQVRAALRLLETHGYIRPATIERHGRGRPREIWITNPLTPKRTKATDMVDKIAPGEAIDTNFVSSVSEVAPSHANHGFAGTDTTAATDPGAASDPHLSALAGRDDDGHLSGLTLDAALLDATLFHATDLDEFRTVLDSAPDSDRGLVLLERHEIGPHALEEWGAPTQATAPPAVSATGEIIGTCFRCGGEVGDREWTFGAWDKQQWHFSGYTLPGAKQLASLRPLLCCSCAVRVKYKLIPPPNPNPPGEARMKPTESPMKPTGSFKLYAVPDTGATTSGKPRSS